MAQKIWHCTKRYIVGLPEFLVYLQYDDIGKRRFYCPALHDGKFLWLDFDINEIQKGKGKVVAELSFKDNSGNIHSRSLGLDFGKLEDENRALAFETSDRRLQSLR